MPSAALEVGLAERVTRVLALVLPAGVAASGILSVRYGLWVLYATTPTLLALTVLSSSLAGRHLARVRRGDLIECPRCGLRSRPHAGVACPVCGHYPPIGPSIAPPSESPISRRPSGSP
ncbi:MAG: hypothetical protein AAFR38_06210 [Planctomycetota bacterium]